MYLFIWGSVCLCLLLSVSPLQFATVYKARDKTTDTIVAIKKVQEMGLFVGLFCQRLRATLMSDAKLLSFVFWQIKVGHRTEAKDGKYTHISCFDHSVQSVVFHLLMIVISH